MDKNKLLVGSAIFLFIVLVVLIATFILKKLVPQKSISANILFLTQPVTTFSGTVEKIEGSIVTISEQAVEQSSIVGAPPPPLSINNPPATNPPPYKPLPTPVTKTLTYKINISEKTVISQPPSFINYLFISPTPAPQIKLSLQDIKVGQTISVNSAVDLRTLSGNQFEAVMVNLPAKMTSLNGKITDINGNIVTVKGFAPMANPNPLNALPPKEKDYRISVNDQTEVSRFTNVLGAKPNEPVTAPKAEKLALGDLKKDMQVSVYTAEDITASQTLTALRIEPFQQIAPNINPALPGAIPPISATPSASPSPSIKP